MMIVPTTVGRRMLEHRRNVMPRTTRVAPSRAAETRVSAVPHPGSVLSTSSTPCGRLRVQGTGNGKLKRDPCGHVKRDPPVTRAVAGVGAGYGPGELRASGSFSPSIGDRLLP